MRFNPPPKSYVITVHSQPGEAGQFYLRLPTTLELPFDFYDVGLLQLRCSKVNQSVNDDILEITQSDQSATLEPFFPNIQAPEANTTPYTYTTKDDVYKFIFDFGQELLKTKFPLQ